MIDVVADLHVHSRYSRAVSPQMTPAGMAQVGRQKGLDILATGDWTHPLWFRELRTQLVESEEGVYKMKSQNPSSKSQINSKDQKETRFLLSVEIATIFSQGGKGRRIHNLVFVPSFGTAEKVNKELLKRGFNLSSDGRPIIGLSSKNLLHMLLEIDEKSLLIPAHAWTPWFGIYGAMSGFESLSEAFEDLAPYVYGIETGLSSDPEMNWQIEELQTRSILSFSDAHSLPKMGREATVFRLESVSYENIRKAIMQPSQHTQRSRESDNQKIRNSGALSFPSILNKVLYTIEFYPEEGKYHYSGHRNCSVTMTPEEQRASNGICPVCKRKVTDGVMRRVQELASDELRIKNKELSVREQKNSAGLQWLTDPRKIHPPFVRLVPLLEIIAEAIAAPVASPKTRLVYEALCSEVTSELTILLKAPIEKIEQAATSITSVDKAKKIAEGVQKVRSAQIVIRPGYDGVYGIVKIWPAFAEATEGQEQKGEEKKTQIGLEF